MPTRLLYIEDNEVDAERLLRMAGHDFDIVVEETLAGGLARLEDGPFDCVLLDLGLPDCGRKEALRLCLEQSDSPIIVITGDDDDLRGAETVRLGAQDFLPKSRLDIFWLKRAVRYAIDRHRAARQRVESMRRWARVLKDIAEVVVLVGRDGTVEWMNRDLFEPDADPARWSGRHVSEIFDDPRVAQLLELSSGERSTLELSHGEQIFDCRAAPSPETGGIVLSIREISEQRELERELNRAKRLAAVGTLAGGVAHDFNNLMTVVIGLTRLVLELEELSPEAAADLNQVVEAGRCASSLVEQLLTFARRRHTEASTFDLVPELQRIESMVRRLLSSDGITLTVDLPDAIMPVHLDKAHLEQIIINLVVNASKAIEGHGKIVISAGEADDMVVVRVSDDGCGMSEEVRSRIFEPFFTTRPGTGTGLGLSTVYGIVQSTGGTIHVTSEVGEGTTFEIFLPRMESAEGADSFAEEVGEGGLDGLRILLVEDRSDVRYALLRQLQSAGAAVDPVEDATQAELATSEKTYDVVVSDVMLLGGNGAVMAEKLLAANPTLRVLLMSGNQSEPEVAKRSSRAAFIPKPFHLSDLVASISRLHRGGDENTRVDA